MAIKDGALLHGSHSPTAQTVGNKLFGVSGAMIYRVTLRHGGGGMGQVDLMADSGDDAAEKALKGNMGAKVTHIEPAPQYQAA